MSEEWLGNECTKSPINPPIKVAHTVAQPDKAKIGSSSRNWRTLLATEKTKA
jgi:hypothetical protein